MVMRGYSVADLDKMTLGMCLNLIKSTDRLKAKARGEQVEDPEEQYQRLKKIQPIVEERYAKGEISEAKYRDFMQSILDYEQD